MRGDYTMKLKEELKIKKVQDIVDEKRRASDGTIIVGEEYTVRDVEDFIIDNIYNKRISFLEKNKSKLEVLLKEKQNDYFTSKDGIYCLGERKFIDIFLNRYFIEQEKFISLIKLQDYFDDPFLGSKMLDEIGYKVITPKEKFFENEKISHTHNKLKKRYFSLVCRKEDFQKIQNMYDNTQENAEIWSIIAKKLFEKTLQKIEDEVSGKHIEQLTYAAGVNFEMYEAANGIKTYNELREMLSDNLQRIKENQNLTEIFLIPESKLVIIKENFVCIVGVYSVDDGLKLGSPSYLALCKFDRVEVEADDKTIAFDATIAPGPLKKRSVVANTVLGTIVGGDIGGIIGAASAIDTNNRRASAVANYRPLIIDMKLCL